MIIPEKGPSKISSLKRRKSNVQKPFVGLINMPRSEDPNPWNCGKSNINKESQYIFGFVSLYLHISWTLLNKFRTQMSRNSNFLYMT